MDLRVYIFSFLCLIYTLCSCQGNPTICLEQGACYIGSWLSSSGNKRYQSPVLKVFQTFNLNNSFISSNIAY